MFCTIGGHIPKEPVVNRRTGALYEKSLILKHLNEKGPRDPVTNEPLTQDDLLDVHGGSQNAAPGVARLMGNNNNNSTTSPAASAASVPGLLNLLQVEWEALTLEQFSLRQQLANTQQELSLALYKHDAACRVIANLVKERDAALAAARSGGGNISSTNNNNTHEDAALRDATTSSAASSGNQAAAQQLINQESGMVPARIAKDLEANSERRKAALNRFEVPPGTSSTEQIRSMVETHNFTPSHVGGVQACATLDVHGSRYVFTGGNEGKVICYNLDKKVTHTSMIGHTKPITKIVARDNICVVTSDDGTGHVYLEDTGSYRTGSTFRHPNGIKDFDVVPSSAMKYGLSAGYDGCLRLHDLETGVTIADGGANRDSSGNQHQQQALGLSTITMHPYGLLGGTGSANTVHLWDIRTMEVDASFVINNRNTGDGNQDAAASSSMTVGNVSSMAFHIDGKSLAVGTGHGVVQLWDLRKLQNPLQTLQWGEAESTRYLKAPISRIAFDQSGQFLSVAGDHVRVWGMKTKCPLALLATHRESPSDVSWGHGASWLVSCSAGERNVKVFEPSS